MLSDVETEAIRRFGIAFQLPGALSPLGEPQLRTVPAVYMISRQGRIDFSYVNPDPSVRLAPKDFLEAARRIAGEGKER